MNTTILFIALLLFTFTCTVLGEWLLASATLQLMSILFIFHHRNLNFSMIIRSGYKKKQMRCNDTIIVSNTASDVNFLNAYILFMLSNR